LDRACDFVGGSHAGLVCQDALGKAVDFHLASNHDPRYRTLYVEKYFKINPVFPTALFFNLEDTHGVTDIAPREEFCRTRFSLEWLAPQGFIDSLFTTLDKSATACAVFAIMRHARQGLADDETRRRFGLLVPHIRRALLIGKVIDLKTVEAAALADSIDTFNAGMFLVDATGRIVHANASGRSLVGEAKVLRAPTDRLGAIDAGADQALLDRIAAAARGDMALGRRGISVPLDAHDGERYVAHVLPLTCGSRRKAGGVLRRRGNCVCAEGGARFAVAARGGLPGISANPR
jgi:hypothetical protein